MSGRCKAHVCACDAGWTGDHCERIKFGKSRKCGEGGLCLHGEGNGTAPGAGTGITSTWGGEAVRADDGTYHVYAAGFASNANLGGWLSVSRVVHGSAKAATGPYTFEGIALGNRSLSFWDGLTQHNPAAQRAPDGTYLLYYMGSTQSANHSAAGGGVGNCSWSIDHGINVSVCRQRVGLATAKAPGGPWTRRDQPVIDVAPDAGAWDSLFTTNPTPHAFANGSVLLIYKARSLSNPGIMSTGAAFAAHWSGPYKRMVSKPIDVSGGCEDAGIYYSKAIAVFRMILHCGCNYQSLWSLNGIDWQRTTSPVPWCNVSLSSGGFELLRRRERPKWLVDPTTGAPVGLLNGVAPPQEDHDGLTYTLFTEIL